MSKLTLDDCFNIIERHNLEVEINSLSSERWQVTLYRDEWVKNSISISETPKDALIDLIVSYIKKEEK